MKSKHIIAGMAALTIGAAFTSCSHDLDYDSIEQQVVDTYNRIFIETFGEPAANQDWGFGTATTKGLTRAADGVWNGTHTKPHDWESGLNFASEAELEATGGIRIDDPNNVAYTDNGQPVYNIPNGSVLYVSSDFDGELVLKEGFNSSCSFYNYGNITGIRVNYLNAKLTFYNAGTMVYTIGSQSHDVYNTGTFIIDNNDAYAKIDNLYNGGNLVLGGGSDTDGQGNLVQNEANIKVNGIIYSTGTGLIELPGGADWMGSFHVDGTVYTDGDIHFQNTGNTKYMCGIVCREDANGNRHDFSVDGDITTSYILTNNILLNGDNIFLTAGGYIKANKISTEGNGRTTLGNEYEAIMVETGKTAMVDVNEFYLKNDKLGDHLGAGVYANFNKVTYKEGGQEKTATSAEEYTSADANFAQSRINNTEVGGVSECGGAWGNTTPNDENDEEEWGEWARIIVEDLSATSSTDFDFNDAVFDVRINSAGTKAQILLKAAGGTLPLTIGWSGEEGTSYNEFEVHNMYNVATNVMVNTNATNGVNGLPDVPKTLTGTFESYDDIKVMVCKQGKWIEIEAFEGEPAAKIRVKPTYEWCKERRNIYEVYNGEKAGYAKSFLDYVQDPNVGSSWYEK